MELPAGGGRPVLHRHASGEVYRLQRGELAIYLEDEGGEVRRILATAGAVVHIPGGHAHTVRNESYADALAFVVFAPGAEIERFVRAAGELTADGEPDTEAILTLAQRHGIEMAGPAPVKPCSPIGRRSQFRGHSREYGQIVRCHRKRLRVGEEIPDRLGP